MTSLRGFLCMVLAAFTAACGTTPSASFYTLRDGPVETKGTGSTLSLALGPVDLPRYLDRPQIVSRDGQSRLRVDEFNRWGGALDEEIERVLASHLGARLNTGRVYAYPSRIVATTDYRVALDIREFDGVLAGEVRLDVAWSLIDDRSSDVVDVGRRIYTAHSDGPEYADYVGALGGLLVPLADDLAMAIKNDAARRKR